MVTLAGTHLINVAVSAHSAAYDVPHYTEMYLIGGQPQVRTTLEMKSVCF
jgi:hypothetical protein